MADDPTPKPEEIAQIKHKPPVKDWMDKKPEFKPGMYLYATRPESLDIVGMPNCPQMGGYRRRLEAAGRLEGGRQRGHKGTPAKIPLL